MPPRWSQPVAFDIMFSGCPSICPILVISISQERLERISSNMLQTFTWTQGLPGVILLANGQGHSGLIKYVYVFLQWIRPTS